MQMHGITVEWNGLPCATSCRYCRNASGSRPLAGVSYTAARTVATRFHQWAKAERPDLRVDFIVGHSYEMPLPQLIDFIRFPVDYGGSVWQHLPLNGLRFRSRDELDNLFNALRQAGIRAVDLAFYGVGADHDAWAGREGDYEYLLSMADSAAACGLSRSENIVLRKPTLDQLPELLRTLDAIPNLSGRTANFMDYLGGGRAVDDERLETCDLALLPHELRGQIDTHMIRPESEWTDAATSQQLQFETMLFCLINVSKENLVQLEQQDCSKTIADVVSDHSARQCLEPPLVELARRYGHRSEKLYALRDMVWKWRGRYYLDTTNEVPGWLDWQTSTVITKYTPVH